MTEAKKIPKDRHLDSTLGFMRDGYHFISNRMKQLDTDIFTARFFGKKLTFLTGKEAAQFFYDERCFKRHGVAPMRVQKTLFGQKAIQGLDGEVHKKRKAMFMSLLTQEYVNDMVNLCRKLLAEYEPIWEKQSGIILYKESQKVLFEGVCQWIGIPYEKERVEEYTEKLGLMIYGFGRVGKTYRKGKQARLEIEQWVKDRVDAVRAHAIEIDTNSPMYRMSMYEEAEGTKLDAQIAAVEIINLMRPVVAIATYVVFEALAIHYYPECGDKLRTKDEAYLDMFCQEVRRFYPYGPFIGAKAKNDVVYNNYEIKKDSLVVLDLYGTNHDPKLWDEPERFKPERFLERPFDLYDLIPQGGGDMDTTHRCAGDVLTVKLMEVFADFLANDIRYQIPGQDLTFSMRRMPTLVNSGLIMTHVAKR